LICALGGSSERPIPFNSARIPRHAWQRLQFRRPLPEGKAYDLFLSIRCDCPMVRGTGAVAMQRAVDLPIQPIARIGCCEPKQVTGTPAHRLVSRARSCSGCVTDQHAFQGRRRLTSAWRSQGTDRQRLIQAYYSSVVGVISDFETYTPPCSGQFEGLLRAADCASARPTWIAK
jgi:hypothetical protein